MPMSYLVLIDDNYYYSDAECRVTDPTFETYKEAVAYCQSRVNLYLEEQYQPGVDAEALYSNYQSFGDDPFIVSDEVGSEKFSAWDYALIRCKEMCANGKV